MGALSMTPCTPDREGAIKIVRECLASDWFQLSSRHDLDAERIVDALLGQPDPEVERQRTVLLNQRWAELGVQVQRAERAEERLRAVTKAAQKVVDGFDRTCSGAHQSALIGPLVALCAVLSEQETQQSQGESNGTTVEGKGLP
jgi:hypothetical protein